MGELWQFFVGIDELVDYFVFGDFDFVYWYCEVEFFGFQLDFVGVDVDFFGEWMVVVVVVLG